MAGEADKLLATVLDWMQIHARVRVALAALAALALLGVAGNFVYELVPRQYVASISGGDILGNRHLLAMVLRDEIAAKGVDLNIRPISSTDDALEKLNAGEIDMALVPAGITWGYPNVRHVATIAPELLHFLVRPEIRAIGDIRGKAVNMGIRDDSTRTIATAVFEFSGLHNGIDYIETNYSNEQLLSMRDDRLPDVIVVASFLPSYVIDDLLKDHKYRLLEMPFPESLAVRVGWVANVKVLAYMYSVVPPVPETDITTIGVNIHLLANKNVDPRAVYQVLDTLYSPAVESRARLKNDEATMTTPSGFALSEGTRQFLARKDPLLSVKTFDTLKNGFGLVMSVLSGVLILLKWFRGPPPEPKATDDSVFTALLARAADIHSAAAQPGADLDELGRSLDQVKAETLERIPSAHLNNGNLPSLVLQAIADTRLYFESERRMARVSV
jgi:TRAP-type uncharacterized transport system substrate-binding protein